MNNQPGLLRRLRRSTYPEASRLCYDLRQAAPSRETRPMPVFLPEARRVTPAQRRRQNLVRAIPSRSSSSKPQPRVADERRRAPHNPSKVVPGRCAVLNSLHPARSCRQYQSAGEMRVLVHQSATRFWDDPLGANQERHAATITDAEADQMRRQPFEIAIGQIGDDPSESFERCEPTDIAGPDIVNERVRVAMQVERRDIEPRVESNCFGSPSPGGNPRNQRIGVARRNSARDVHDRRPARALDPRLEPNAATPG
jgi:hypothetical protein